MLNGSYGNLRLSECEMVLSLLISGLAPGAVGLGTDITDSTEIAWIALHCRLTGSWFSTFLLTKGVVFGLCSEEIFRKSVAVARSSTISICQVS